MLFVCTGNICRSPIAERLAANYGVRHQIQNFEASSAGTQAVVAHPIHHQAASVLEKLGGDATNFAARQLTAKMAANADLVLAMTKAHRDRVLELAPRLLRRVFTLAEASQLASSGSAESIADLCVLRPHFSGLDLPDVADPIGQSAKTFEEVGLLIADLLPPILELCRRSVTAQ